VFQEIETDDDTTTAKVNMAKLKSYSGNDVSITARTLYKTQEEFKPTFQIVICMNKLPTLSTVDGGTRRRVRNVPFESKFVDDADDVKWRSYAGKVFEIDRNLKTQIPFMGAALMRILLNNYNIYYNSTIVIPSKIAVASSEFIEQHNEDINFIIQTIIKPHLIFTDNKRDFVQFVFLKKYVQDHVHSHKTISTTVLYDALEETFADNYNPRYRDANKKDFNKCLQYCTFDTRSNGEY